MANMEDRRFVIVYKQGNGLTYKDIMTAVIVDKVTGVNDIFCRSSDAGGLTPLLDENGKPVIIPIEKLKADSFGGNDG